MQAYKLEYGENKNIRYEILNGKIVYMAPSPTPNHNKIVNNICRIFGAYLEGKKCEVFGENVDVYFDEENKEVKPDVKIVCDPNKIKANGIVGSPDLIVEVLSPSTASKDKGQKKKLYEKYGVKEYWIVSQADCSIDVYILTQSGILELDNVYQIYPDYLIESMTEQQISEIAKEFKTSLYDDLVIPIEKVFDKVKKI